VSGYQEEDWTSYMLEAHLIPWGALDVQEVTQGASPALGALAVLPALEVQLRLSGHVPAGLLGHS